MLIDCDTCEVRGQACSECVIGVLLRRPPAGTPVDLDADEAAAFGSLAGAGMVPPLQLVPLMRTDAHGVRFGRDTPDDSHSRATSVPRAAASWTREPPRSGRCEGIA